MTYEEIGDIRRNGLVIPGGWKAPVLNVRATPGDDEFLVNHLVHMGYDEDDAARLAIRMVQERYTFGFIHGLRMSIMNYAQRYMGRYPSLVQQEGWDSFQLRGFKPEIVQGYYLPSIGGGKDSGIDEVLEEMAREAI